MRRSILSEKNLVVILFVLVIIIFSFAQQDTRKMEKMYFQSNAVSASGKGMKNVQNGQKTPEPGLFIAPSSFAKIP